MLFCNMGETDGLKMKRTDKRRQRVQHNYPSSSSVIPLLSAGSVERREVRNFVMWSYNLIQQQEETREDERRRERCEEERDEKNERTTRRSWGPTSSWDGSEEDDSFFKIMKSLKNPSWPTSSSTSSDIGVDAAPSYFREQWLRYLSVIDLIGWS